MRTYIFVESNYIDHVFMLHIIDLTALCSNIQMYASTTPALSLSMIVSIVLVCILFFDDCIDSSSLYLIFR